LPHGEPGRDRADRADLHQPQEPAHAGLHHRPVRITGDRKDRDMTEHTVKSFSADLEELAGDIARMGGLAEDMLSDAVQAIATRDSALADTVVARDPQIDALQIEAEKKILRLLALRQPLARDLRQTISALKIAAELERIGDLSKNIAKRSRILDMA